MNSKITDDIDLLAILKKVYFEKKFILKTSILAALFGVIYALSQPNEYTASTTFIPQISSGIKSAGSPLSGLASLAGINLGGIESSSVFPPTLYPQVVDGMPFKLDLLSSKLDLDNQTLSVREYYLSNKGGFSFNFLGTIKKYTIGLPSLIYGSFNNKNEDELILNDSNIYSVTSTDKELVDTLLDYLYLSINQKEGFITISFTDTNKNIAAQITKIAQNLLQEKIIEFKNKASKEMLDFAMKQYSEKKNAHEKLQDERAVFVDKNINISSSLFQNKLSRIESEVNISELIVQQLASQVEQAKLQVNKDTPVFTTIKPVIVPYERSAPKRTYTVILFFVIGFAFSISYIFLKKPIKDFFRSLES